MGLETGTILAITAAIAAVGTGVSVQQSRKAGEAQEEAQEAQGRIAERETQRARVKSVREARIRRASVLARSGAAGTAGSAGEVGALSSIQAQVGANIGELGAVQGLSRVASGALADAAKFQRRAGTAQAVGGLARSFIGFDFAKLGSPDPSAATTPTAFPTTRRT